MALPTIAAEAAKICRPCIAGAGSLLMMADDKQGGFFGNLINNALLKMVEVRGNVDPMRPNASDPPGTGQGEGWHQEEAAEVRLL